MAEPLVVPLSNSSSLGTPRAVAEPLRTITTAKGGDMALAAPLVAPYYGSGSGLTSTPVTEPVPAVTTKARFGLAEPFLVPNFSERDGQEPRTHSLDGPLPTITASGHIQLAEPMLLRAAHGDSDGRDPASRVLDAEQPLPAITGSNEFAVAQPVAEGVRIDIHYRMLHWRELSRATSFDDEGEEYDFAGTATEITKQIGNAVPVRMGTALVRTLMEDAA